MKKIKVIENSRFLSNEAMNEVHGGGEILCPGSTQFFNCEPFSTPNPCVQYGPICSPFEITPIGCHKYD